jgi:hypothetical protein
MRTVGILFVTAGALWAAVSFFALSGVALPYQYPTPMMLRRQAPQVRFLEFSFVGSVFLGGLGGLGWWKKRRAGEGDGFRGPRNTGGIPSVLSRSRRMSHPSVLDPLQPESLPRPLPAALGWSGLPNETALPCVDNPGKAGVDTASGPKPRWGQDGDP